MLLITSTNLACNPRCLKELRLLIALQAKVTVLAFNLHNWTTSKEVTLNNAPLELTRKEYELLLYFISNKRRVISKNAIAEHLWGDELEGNYDFIYTHIKNLRKKLMEAGVADYIKSVYGMGYKFSDK